MNNNKPLVILCEGAIMIALALALSFIEFSPMPYGGSISLAMIPILVFAIRRGPVLGIGAAFIFGTLKFFTGGVGAIDWLSLIFDYSIAYTVIGIVGFFKKKPELGVITGVGARFLVHIISGATIWAKWAEEVYLGIKMPNVFVYSVIYNSIYMIPNMIICTVAISLIFRKGKEVFILK